VKVDTGKPTAGLLPHDKSDGPVSLVEKMAKIFAAIIFLH